MVMRRWNCLEALSWKDEERKQLHKFIIRTTDASGYVRTVITLSTSQWKLQVLRVLYSRISPSSDFPTHPKTQLVTFADD